MLKKTRKLANVTIYSIIIVTLVSTVLVSGLILYYASNGIEDLSLKQSQLLSTAINLHIEAFIEDKTRIMDEFILFYRAQEEDHSARQAFYGHLMDLHPEFSRLMIIDRQGQVAYTYPEDKQLIGTDHAYYAYYNLAREEGLFWSDTFYDVANNLPRVALSKKVKDQVLVAYIDLKEINKFIRDLDVNEKSVLAILDESGTYIAHNQAERVIQREKDKDVIHLLNQGADLKEVAFDEKTDYLQYVQKLAVADWLILIRQSKAPLHDLQRNIVLLSVVLVGIMVLVFMVVSLRRLRSIRGSFDHFTANLLHLSQGAYDHRVTQADYTEFWVLGQEFNRMAESIQTRDKTIQELNADLESKVEERTRLLDASNHELQSTIDNLQETQEKLIASEKMASIGQVVAGVAHEINTPIGIGVTLASYLGDQTDKINAEFEAGKLSKKSLGLFLKDVNNSSNIMLETLERASDLIQNFKQVAVDQTNIERVTFKPCTIIKSVVESLRVQAHKQGVEIRFDCKTEASVNSWPGRLSQVTMNLVQNALKHGMKGRDHGLIELTLDTYDKGISLKVKDNGVGISPENMDKIYDPFYTTGRMEGSTGLGLNIVHNLVESAYEGKIECMSHLGQGTEFYIRLPMILMD